MEESSHQKHGGASSVDVGKDGDQDGTKEGSSSREAVPDDSKNETITDLSNVSFRGRQLQCLQYQVELSFCFCLSVVRTDTWLVDLAEGLGDRHQLALR